MLYTFHSYFSCSVIFFILPTYSIYLLHYKLLSNYVAIKNKYELTLNMFYMKCDYFVESKILCVVYLHTYSQFSFPRFSL